MTASANLESGASRFATSSLPMPSSCVDCAGRTRALHKSIATTASVPKHLRTMIYFCILVRGILKRSNQCEVSAAIEAECALEVLEVGICVQIFAPPAIFDVQCVDGDFKTMSVPPLRHLLAAIVLMLMTFPLHATTLLPPGGTLSPVQGSPIPGNINSYIIDETSAGFFFAPGAGATFLSGQIEEAVLLDPFRLTCSTCLDFAFRISVDDTSSFSVYQAIL